MRNEKQNLSTSTTLYDMLIDQYKLKSHYTQTAVSDLYRAKDTHTQQPVALEILHPAFGRSYCAAYVAKMEAVKQLEHPNIAPIYTIGYVTQRPYIAREFIEGYRFSERLTQLEEQKTPVNSIYALKMVRELADALALAETHQIYHHYLFPDRLILKHGGTLVLVDLGVPEVTGGYKNDKPRSSDQQSNAFYLSPEQRSGKGVNGRSHIYTLGIILYQLLTGLPPTAPPTIWQKMRGGKQNLPQLRPDLSPPLYELVEKCLHTEAWRRYPDLQTLTAVLDATLEAETIYIQTGDTPPTIATTKERRPWMYLIVPLLLVLACVTIAYTAVQILQPNDTALTQQLNKVSTPPIPTDTPTDTISIPASEPTVTNLPEATEELAIQITGPLREQKFELGSTIVFTWTWPILLAQNQTFIIFIADENGEKEIGRVQQTNEQGMYELRVNSANFAADRGIYLWRIELQDEERGELLFASNTNPLRVVQTNTATAVSATPVTEQATTAPPIPTATATTHSSSTPLVISTIPPPLPTNTPIPPTGIPLPTNTAVPPTQAPSPTSPPLPTATVPPLPTATRPPPPTVTIPPPP